MDISTTTGPNTVAGTDAVTAAATITVAYAHAYATLASAATGIFDSTEKWAPVLLRRGKSHGKGQQKPRSRIGWLRLAVEMAIERAFGVESGSGSDEMSVRWAETEVEMEVETEMELDDGNPAPVPVPVTTTPQELGLSEEEGAVGSLHPLWVLEMKCREISHVIRCAVGKVLAFAGIKESLTFEDEYPIPGLESYNPYAEDDLLKWYESIMAAETEAESDKGTGDVCAGGEGGDGDDGRVGRQQPRRRGATRETNMETATVVTSSALG